MRDTPVEHSTSQLHLQALRLQLECKGTKVPRKCPLCSSKDWANDKEVDLQKIGPQIDEVDSVLEGLIMGEYRKGRSCVDISIAQGIPYSLVFETVRRNSANINIKV